MLTPEELMYHLNACAQNNRKSQAIIYNYLYGYGMVISGRYTDDREDVKEILHDGLFKIFKMIHHFQPSYADIISSFKGWAHTIINYTAIDHFRRNRRYKALKSLEKESYLLPPVYDSIEERLTQKEIVRTIQDISPVYQLVLKLHAFEGLEHKEIARKLDISIGSSKSNLSKARKQLQKKLLQLNGNLL